MTKRTAFQLFVFTCMVILLFSCGKVSETFVENINIYKQRNDLQNLKYYLLYKVDYGKLQEYEKVIFIFESKLQRINTHYDFDSKNKEIDSLISFYNYSCEDKHEEAAIALEYFIKNYKLNEDKIIAHIFSNLAESINRSKIDINVIKKYIEICKNNNYKSQYLQKLFLGYHYLLNGYLQNQEVNHELAKLYGFEIMRSLINDNHNYNKLKNEAVYHTMIQKLNNSEDDGIEDYKNFLINNCPINSPTYYKYLNILALRNAVNNIDSDFNVDLDSFNIKVDLNDYCNFYYYTQSAIYSIKGNAKLSMKAFNFLLNNAQESSCNYYYKIAKEGIIKIDNSSKLEKDINEIHALKSSQCHPYLSYLSSNDQYYLSTINYFSNQCKLNNGSDCNKIEILLNEYEKYLDTLIIDRDHKSDAVTQLATLKLNFAIANKSNNLNYLIQTFNNSKARYFNFKNELESKIISIDENKQYNYLIEKIKRIKADLREESAFIGLDKILLHELISLYKYRLEIENDILHRSIILKPINEYSKNIFMDKLNVNKGIYIDMLQYGQDFYILYLAKDTAKIEKRTISESMSNSIIKFKSLISNPQSNLDSIKNYGKFIYEFITPTDIELDGIENYIFCPTGIFYDLPFEAITTNKNNYLFEEVNIRYVSSIEKLKTLAYENLEIKNEALFSYTDLTTLKSNSNNNYPELPFAINEIEYIHKILPNSEISSGKNFTNKKLLQSFKNFDAIHVASHAYSSSDNKYRNYIITRNRNEVDSIFGFEFENISSNVELIFLNGCVTHYGQEQLGEGYFSLANNFEQNAKNIISTRYRINDLAAYQFTKNFYSNLNSNHSISKSLHNARLEMLHSKRFSHPNYWGGYVWN